MRPPRTGMRQMILERPIFDEALRIWNNYLDGKWEFPPRTEAPQHETCAREGIIRGSHEEPWKPTGQHMRANRREALTATMEGVEPYGPFPKYLALARILQSEKENKQLEMREATNELCGSGQYKDLLTGDDGESLPVVS